MGFYLNSQGPSARPHLELKMKLTGFVIFNNEVVVDAVDRYPTFFLFTPALAKAVDQGPQDFLYGLKLVDGAGGVPAVEREIITELPPGPGFTFHVTSVVEGQVNQSIEPEATALAVFGAIALLAGLLIAGQSVGRLLAQNENEAAVLRALGAGPQALVLDSLTGITMAIVAGALLAVGVAVAVSPLSPLGPVRGVYPGRGPAGDLTVLGPGAALLVLCTGGVALALAARTLRSTQRRWARAERALPSAIARLLAPREPPLPSSLAPALPSSRAGAVPRCPCDRCCWPTCWRWPSWPPPSISAAASARWSPTRAFTAGTGTTRFRATPCRPSPCPCWPRTPPRPGPTQSLGLYPGPTGLDSGLAVHRRRSRRCNRRPAGRHGLGAVAVGPVRPQ